MTPVYRGLATA